MTEDERNLNLLSIFHYVVGGIIGLFACLPLLHVTLGVLLLTGNKLGGSNPPPTAVGWLFVIVGGLFVLGGWTLAGSILWAGRKLRLRESRIFCLVVAGLECTMMPLGTVLGIFTILVLMKEPVKQLFDRHDQPYRGAIATSSGATPSSPGV